MDRNWESGASGTPPLLSSLASAGFPTDGDPGSAVPATIAGAAWYHMITEELRALVVGAGLSPDHTSVAQVLGAVQALVLTGVATFIERMFGGDYAASVSDTSFVQVPGSSVIEVDGTGLGALQTEVHVTAKVDSGTGSVRLWDITAGAQIGSTQTFTNTSFALVKITGLAGLLATANHQLRIDVHGASATDMPVITGGRLLIK